MKNNQSGMGVVEMLLILVVVGILGFTGWFVWQSQQKTTQTLDAANSSQTATLSKQKASAGQTEVKTINKAFGVDMSFTYPKSWRLTDVIEGPVPLNEAKGNTSEAINITAPSGNYRVVYKIGANGGLGGACSPEDGGVIKFLASSTVSNFTNTSYAEVFANNIVTEIRDGKVLARGTAYSASLMSTDKIAATEVGKSYCDLYLANVITLAEKNNVTLLGASLEFPGLPLTATQNEFQAKLSGTEYQQAKAILLSTTVK